MEDWRPIGRDEREVWQATAEQLELRFRPGTVNNPPHIHGEIDGFHVAVTCSFDRRDKGSSRTTYELSYSSLGAPIRIARQSTMARFGIVRRLIDLDDLEIGDSAFDNVAIIDAAEVDVARAFLTSARRNAIAQLLAMSELDGVVVSETTTTFETPRIEGSARRLVGNLLGMAEFAKILSRSDPAGGPPPSDSALPSEPLRSLFDAPNQASQQVQDEIR